MDLRTRPVPVTNRNKIAHVLTAASMKFRVFWGVAPCSHVEVDRDYTALHPRRLKLRNKIVQLSAICLTNLSRPTHSADGSHKMPHSCRRQLPPLCVQESITSENYG
jgi:hypothetical protein